MNSSLYWIIAAVDLPGLQGGGNALAVPSRRTFGDAALIIALGIGIALVVMIWAKFFRKAGEAETKHHWLQDAAEEDSDRGHSRRKKRKRLRREHRPRNPTLAETGGLPPSRPGDPPGGPQ